MAGCAVCTGGMAKCAFGAAPTPLTFLPTSMTMASTGPIGSCVDCVPFVNIKPFGVCMSLANPTTAALTAAAFGVLTPGPCIPVPAGTWIPTGTTMVASGPILTQTSVLTCAYGGVIQIMVPGQFTVQA